MHWWGIFSLFFFLLCLLCMLGLPYVLLLRAYRCSTKTLCVSPFIWAEDVFTSLLSSLSLCFFTAQVLFCFIEENWDAWTDAILGSGLQWVQKRRWSWENLQGFDTFCFRWTIRKGYFEEQIVNESAIKSKCMFVNLWPIIRIFNDFWYVCFHSSELLFFGQVSFKSLQKSLELF